MKTLLPVIGAYPPVPDLFITRVEQNFQTIQKALNQSYTQGQLLSANATALTTSTFTALTSVTISPGIWYFDGVITYTPANTTVLTVAAGAYSMATNNFPSGDFFRSTIQRYSYTSAGNPITISLPHARISVDTLSTFYLVAFAAFTTSTCTAYGQIEAQRFA